MSHFAGRQSFSSSRYRYGARAALLLATTALTSPFLVTAALAQSLPTGGSVAAGSVTIAQPSATQLNITQSSQSAVVNWQGFSIGAGSAVNIVQPNASSAILNRVTGNTPSTIAGALTANGQVYLVNPNGIAITSSGTVNTAGFVASTLGITDSDFMAGRRTFAGNGASAGVSNAGTITIGRGGYAALIGGTASNAGSINVPLGKVGLGSGERATLDFSGDGFLQVAMPTASGGSGALIRNSGTIKADGGSVIINAATAREAARNAINISGVVQARSISGHNGSIVIGGGEGGKVAVSGKLNAASRRHNGGAITVTGKDIALKGATVDASGKTGGGSIRIGGDALGQGSLQQAQSVTMDANTQIHADATGTGNGGNVTLWSTGTTSVAGLITAKGGADGGNGGLIETSGHHVDFTGLRVDTSAPKGITGSWLVDPTDLTVDAAASTISSNLASTNVTLQTTATTASGPGTQSAGPGDIYINAPISWSSANSLTLSAYNSINIISSITATGNGQLVLTTNNNIGGANSAGNLNFYGSGNVQLQGASAALTINGTPYTLIHNRTQLEAINNNTNAPFPANPEIIYVVGNYALAQPIDLAGTTYTDAVIAGAGSYGFTGTFNGLGNTISNLTINALANNYSVGLFGILGNFLGNNTPGTVANLGLIGGSVTSVSSSAYVGALAGANMGTITNVYASTSVTDNYFQSSVGGLAGYNWGVIDRSRASGTVTSNVTANWAGGLVGYNDGYSSGNQVGTIINSYATGAVNGGGGTGNASGAGTGSSTGGLAGFNGGVIINSYSTGAVTGGVSTYLGGLVAENNTVGGVGTITNSYWDTTTSGISTVNHGGGTGLTTAALQNGSLPTGFSSSVWNAVSGRYPLLGPRILTVNLAAQSASYGTAYTLDQSTAAYTETENGTQLTGGSFVTLTGLSIAVAGTGNTSGTTTSTNAGSYLMSASGASLSGFIISYGTSPAYLTVNQRAVTLTGTQVYNGSTAVTATLTASNLVGGDTLTVSGTATGTLASANVGTRAMFSLAGLSLSNSNYTLTGGTGSVTVTPHAVTLTGSQAYNGSTAVTATLTASNLIGGDTLTVSGTATGTLASANAGARAMSSLAGLSLSNINYTLTGAAGTVTINPLAVTLTGLRGYNGGTGVASGILTASNVVGADNVGLTGSGSVASANANATPQTLNLAGLSLSNANYTLTGGSGTVTINPLAVTLTGSRSYNGGTGIAAGILTASNVVGADNIGLTGSGSVASANANATPQTLNLAGLSLSNTNYTLTGASGAVTINPLAVTLTGTQVYNGATAVTATLTASNLIGGDTLTVSGAPTGTVASANAGARAMSSLSGLSLSNANYTLTGGTGTVTVTPLAVILSGSRSYDGGTSVASGILTASNVVGVDNIGLSGTGSVISANASGTPQTLNLSGLSLSNANYTLTGASGAVTINPLAVILTGTQVYNGATAVTATLTASNLIGGDILTITGTPTGAMSSANAGARAMSSLSGLSLSNTNYTLTGGTGTVTVTPLTVILSGSRSYDGGTGIAAGVLTASNGVGVDNIGLSGAGSVASANANATPQALNLTGLSLSNANYTLTGASGNVTINPLAVTLTGTQAYNGSAAVTAALTTSNLIGGDTLTITGTPTGTLASANAGTRAMSSLAGLSISSSNYTLTGGTGTVTINPLAVTLTGSRSYNGGTGIGAGILTASNVVGADNIGLTGSGSVVSANANATPQTLNLSGLSLSNANYTLTGASGAVTINPLAVTLTGTQVYNGSTAVTATLTASNLIGGDLLTVSGPPTGTLASANAGARAMSSLAGLSLNNSNYTLTSGTGAVTVTPASTTVSALGGTSVYGASPANPGLSATGLQNGESIAVLTGLANSFGITGTSGVAGSPYTLSVTGTLTNANYTISARNTGTWIVTAAPIVVTAVGGTSVYGASPVNPGLAAIGLQNGESPTVLTGLSNSFGIDNLSSVGGSPYTLSVVGTLTNPNYTIAARNAGIWTVTSASSDASLFASVIAGNGPDSALPQDNAKQLQVPISVVTSLGIGTLHADPRFSGAIACFGGGNGTAQSCFATAH
ncbi:two-partner secretion system adhesin CdrA [soil metagenome]